jgi:CRISPR/Cas system-associated protein Cas5 (RAMP superfamily)
MYHRKTVSQVGYLPEEKRKTKLRVFEGQLYDDGLSSPNTLRIWYVIVNPCKYTFMFVTNTGCMYEMECESQAILFLCH